MVCQSMDTMRRCTVAGRTPVLIISFCPRNDVTKAKNPFANEPDAPVLIMYMDLYNG